MHRSRSTPAPTTIAPARRAVLLASVASVALFASTGLSAADESPKPEVFADAKAMLVAGLPDVDRTVTRYAGTPYAGLMRTAWGTMIQAGMSQGLDRPMGENGPTFREVLASMDAALVSLRMDAANPDEPGVTFAVRTNSPAPITRLLEAGGQMTKLAVPAGSDATMFASNATAENFLTAYGKTFVIQTGPAVTKDAAGNAAPAAKGTPIELPITAADADMTMFLNYANLGEMAAAMGAMTGQPVPWPEEYNEIRLVGTVKLDPIGVREDFRMTGPKRWLEMLKANPMPKADLTILDTLPESTVWALSIRMDKAVTGPWFDMAKEGMDPAQLKTIDDALAEVGLPDYRSLVTSLDGTSVLYCESVGPAPSLTLALAMVPETAKIVLDAMGPEMGLVKGDDGVWMGSAGPFVVQAGLVDRHLVLTTNPLGLVAWKERSGGFTKHPAIQQALREIPAEAAMIAGVSRSADSWGALGDLAQTFLMAQGTPGVETLGADLRAAGKYGYLFQTIEADGTFRLAGGGLIGPMTGGMLGGGALGGVMWFRMMGGMRGGMGPGAF